MKKTFYLACVIATLLCVNSDCATAKDQPAVMPEQKQQEQKRYSIKAYADTEHEQITIEISQNIGFGYSVFVFESDFLDFEYAD